ALRAHARHDSNLNRFPPWNAFHGSNGSSFEPELACFAGRRAPGARRGRRGGVPHENACASGGPRPPTHARPISAYPPADSHPATMPASTNTPVYRVRGLTRIYRMGEVEIHALRGVDLDLYEG